MIIVQFKAKLLTVPFSIAFPIVAMIMSLPLVHIGLEVKFEAYVANLVTVC